MNSKSFLTAVLVAVSFFALCFVWEMRSVLPEGGGKEIAVGACAGGQAKTSVVTNCELYFRPREQFYIDVTYQGQVFPIAMGCKDANYSLLVCSAETGQTPNGGDGDLVLSYVPCNGIYVPKEYTIVFGTRILGNETYTTEECIESEGTATSCGSKKRASGC